MAYVTAETIKTLREEKSMTQKQLAEKIGVSDKTVSKWETGRGLPDIGILNDLSSALGISVAELMTGDVKKNSNRSSNMKKSGFYVCPVCGNIIHSIGEGNFCCCGITLPRLETEPSDQDHEINIEVIDDEYVVSLSHPMSKTHCITFAAYVTDNSVHLQKLYPESGALIRFPRQKHGTVYVCCNRHGLFAKNV